MTERHDNESSKIKAEVSLLNSSVPDFEKKRHVKVLKLHILKPAGDMKWDELGALLRDARYRVFRLANLAISEAYLDFHKWRSGGNEQPKLKISQLNRNLRSMLEDEVTGKQTKMIKSDRYSKSGALPDSIVSPLSMYKLGGLTSKSKWSEVLRGKSSLPTFKLNMAIPVRCDKPGDRRIERTKNGDAEVELRICLQPYPRVIIATGRNSLGDGQRAILDRLLDNTKYSEQGYRQRCFEIKEDQRSGKWHLFVTYDFPAIEPAKNLSRERIVGVDLGAACPLYAAINTGHARLGWKHFSPLAARVRALQNQTIRRRRQILRGGKVSLSEDSARSGHGRKRKLKPISKLEGKIDRAYTTLNHQLSATVIKFAKDNGAGVVQMEDLKGLRETLTGTFLGERWRYEELQRFIRYKADEAGIEIRLVNPQYTSRRCSECGHIHKDFTREFRDKSREGNKSVRFLCPDCGFTADPDYNAARNLASLDIAAIIERQLEIQGLRKHDP
jgi:IS605 OrfB family transposase